MPIRSYKAGSAAVKPWVDAINTQTNRYVKYSRRNIGQAFCSDVLTLRTVILQAPRITATTALTALSTNAGYIELAEQSRTSEQNKIDG